jgi:4-hydroxy-2-oxoheptanedioate aldolase
MASIGIDLAFIEGEHHPLDRDQLSWMCHAYKSRGVAPIVRIPEPDPYLACMALDGGAQGIIVPYVESAAQVRELRGAVKLRPLKGQQLRDVLDGKKELDDETAKYLANNNRDNVLIVNIESIPALEAYDEIISEPGLDAAIHPPQVHRRHH